VFVGKKKTFYFHVFLVRFRFLRVVLVIGIGFSGASLRMCLWVKNVLFSRISSQMSFFSGDMLVGGSTFIAVFLVGGTVRRYVLMDGIESGRVCRRRLVAMLYLSANVSKRILFRVALHSAFSIPKFIQRKFS